MPVSLRPSTLLAAALVPELGSHRQKDARHEWHSVKRRRDSVHGGGFLGTGGAVEEHFGSIWAKLLALTSVVLLLQKSALCSVAEPLILSTPHSPNKDDRFLQRLDREHPA